MKNENNSLSNDEIREIISLARKPGLRFTIDLYLLDYIKHCFLEDDQLNGNIQKLQTALAYLENEDVKKGLEDVIKNLQCVQSEYNEYVEDMHILVSGGYPEARGVAP